MLERKAFLVIFFGLAILLGRKVLSVVSAASVLSHQMCHDDDEVPEK